MGGSEVCIFVAFVVLQCYFVASLGYFQCYISCKLCVCYCTGIWTGAATRQFWCSQGADTRFTICCVFVADACDICDVVVSGPYLRHCNPPPVAGPWIRARGRECDKMRMGTPMRRIGGKGGWGQRADVRDLQSLAGSPYGLSPWWEDSRIAFPSAVVVVATSGTGALRCPVLHVYDSSSEPCGNCCGCEVRSGTPAIKSIASTSIDHATL